MSAITFACRVLATIGVCTSWLAAAGDFNGDGKQDVLWRLPAGNPLIWQMDGLRVTAQHSVASTAGASSSIIGTGKFFGSQNNTIAWVDSSDNLRLLQIAGGGSVTQSCMPASGIDPKWKFLAIFDIDNDGVDDVLWRLDDGQVVALLMNGCNEPTPLYLTFPTDPAWSFSGAGRLGGSDPVSLYWTDADNSQVIIWTVSNRGTVTQSSIPSAGQTGWSICAVADFNGDRDADILWRNPADNTLVLWLRESNGYTVVTVSAATSGVFGAADGIFINGFDTTGNMAPPLGNDWTILEAADFDGDGNADLLLANNTGDSAVWLMNGANVKATARFAPLPDMPLPGLTGWRLPLDRPIVTKVDGQVSVGWTALLGTAQYGLYASAKNAPANSGILVSNAPPPLSFERTAPDYVDKRYFAVTASYHGLQLPPSNEAYIVEFTPVSSAPSGFMSVADLNGDGCPDIFRALGDCHGHFSASDVYSTGLSSMYAPATVGLRDVRLADFNGDGVPDIVANVYTCDAEGCGGATANSRLMLLFGNGDGTYTEAATFNQDNIFGGGYGETILVADFNNDGCLDIYAPRYTFYDSGEHNSLLINDCHGNFTDQADAAGVAMRGTNAYLRPEGAQALDINNDGWIDLYAGSELFINNGDLTFTNVGITDNASGVTSVSPWGIAAVFDEGLKFIDCDNSGQPCLAVNAIDAIRIFKFDGVNHFSELAVIPSMYMNESWGLTATDIDGDGRTDLVVAGGIDQSVESGAQYQVLREQLDDARSNGDLDLDDVLDTSQTPNAMPQLLVNRGQYVIHDLYDDGRTPSSRPWNDLQTFGDFDFSGTMDLATRFGSAVILMNQSRSSDTITVSIVGKNGEQNQQGRLVRVSPSARPNVTMLQVVDSGSGYMSNGPYDLTFATPYPGSYNISVRFADATYTTAARIGDHVTMYANGTVAIKPRL
jgi:hypothetical protein